MIFTAGCVILIVEAADGTAINYRLPAASAARPDSGVETSLMEPIMNSNDSKIIANEEQNGSAAGTDMSTSCTEENVSRVLDIATKAGRILLENGAEISRVEETMVRIAAHYGVRHDNFFVLANGIFTTGWDRNNEWPGSFAKVLHIPMRATRLDRIAAVNQLSRSIIDGKYTLDEAESRLAEIRESSPKSKWLQLAGAFLGSACFSVLFGGSLYDAVGSAVTGFFVWLFMLYVYQPYLSKITGNITGSVLATMICIVLHKLGIGNTLGQMIIGAVVLLIPGVAFTNGVRDIADGDYISGVVRLLDAMLGFLCIAVGVGVTFLILRYLFGGVI